MTSYSEAHASESSALPGMSFDLFRQVPFSQLSEEQIYDIRVDFGSMIEDGTLVQSDFQEQGDNLLITDTRTGEQIIPLISPIFEGENK